MIFIFVMLAIFLFARTAGLMKVIRNEVNKTAGMEKLIETNKGNINQQFQSIKCIPQFRRMDIINRRCY